MICNYQNIFDYCLNQYSYQFISISSNNGVIGIDKSENAPVLRTDKTTGENKVISQFSTDLIKLCNSNDDNENITEWECYKMYRHTGSGYISDPPVDILKNGQIDIINNAYESSLADGIKVNINNQNVILGSNIEDQIYYQSILNYAQVLHDDDTNAIMPSFTDAQNKTYSMSYDTLVSIFKTYFNKVIYYKNLKESLVAQSSKASNIFDIQQLDWCSTKVISSNIQPTTIVPLINHPFLTGYDPTLASCYNGQCYEISFENINNEVIKGASIFDSIKSCYNRCGQNTCSGIPSGWNCATIGATMETAANIENFYAPSDIEAFYDMWLAQALPIAQGMRQQGYINVKIEYANYSTNFSDTISRPLDIQIKGECDGTLEGYAENIPDYASTGVLGFPLGRYTAGTNYFYPPQDVYIRRCNHS